MGDFAGIWRDFLGPINHKMKQRLKNFRKIFGAFFVRKFVPRKKSFVPTSFCRRATLNLWRFVREGVIAESFPQILLKFLQTFRTLS